MSNFFQIRKLPYQSEIAEIPSAFRLAARKKYSYKNACLSLLIIEKIAALKNYFLL
jgi:hypothetical protein